MRMAFHHARDGVFWCLDQLAMRAGVVVDAWLNRGFRQFDRYLAENARRVNEDRSERP